MQDCFRRHSAAAIPHRRLLRSCVVIGWWLATPVLGRADAQSASPCPRADLPAYAHNDYENRRPLMDAVTQGFRGVEADIYLVDGVLRVGHDRNAARMGGSFETLYLAPLRLLLTQCNGFATLAQPFFVAVEIKEASNPTYTALVALLQQYRDVLLTPPSTPHAPVEVVLVGWHPTSESAIDEFGAGLRIQYRLRRSDQGLPDSPNPRVRLISVDYGKTMGRWWVTARARQRWLSTLQATKQRAPNLLVRVHNVPVDAHLYTMLLNAGVDLIGTKHVEQTAHILRATER